MTNKQATHNNLAWALCAVSRKEMIQACKAEAQRQASQHQGDWRDFMPDVVTGFAEARLRATVEEGGPAAHEQIIRNLSGNACASEVYRRYASLMGRLGCAAGLSRSQVFQIRRIG